MDPIESIDIKGDSSFVLGLEAQARDYELYYYQPKDLFFDHAQGVLADASRLQLRRKQGDHFTVHPKQRMHIGEFDVILLRQDPPFNMTYLTTTWLLEHAPATTLVVNDPKSVRDAPEKLLITHFPDLIPPTLITRDQALIENFRDQHESIIIKPLYGNGGAGIFHLERKDHNLSSLLEIFAERSNEPLMIQAFLPEVAQGDKRIILADGKPAGIINRVAAQGEIRSNMHVGGKAIPADYAPRDLEIIEKIAPILQRMGLIFAGIDVIGNYLTEINVTSPTGLQEVTNFTGKPPEKDIWDAIEARLALRS